MPAPSLSRAERLAALRAEVKAIESAGAAEGRDCLPFGIDAIDRRLAGGGLAVPGLHEMAGTRPGLGDDAAATLFIAGIAARLAAEAQKTMTARTTPGPLVLRRRRS